jgi:MFS family permease
MSTVRRSAENMTRREWSVVLLLAASVIINYIDRSNLGIAAPVLEQQLSLSPLQMGSLLAAFSWTYALLQLIGISGWLTDRFPVGLVILWGYVVWSAATIATGLVSGFAMLFAARLLLGAGESVAYPCYSRIFAELPQQHRGRANALIDAGTKLGPAAGAFVGGALLVHFGWRVLFLVLGIGGLAWILPWIKLMPRRQPGAPQVSEPTRSTMELLGMRSAWGSFLGLFCGNYFFYFLLTWLPRYLVRETKMPLGATTRFTSVLFLWIALATLSTGWISDHLIARGASVTRVRKTVLVGGLSVASSLVFIAVSAGNPLVTITILFFACIGYGAYASNHWAVSQTLAGPAMAGRWTSVQNGVGNLAGIAAPWVAGAVVQRNGSSRLAFFITGIVALIGALLWLFLVPSVEQVTWKLTPLANFPDLPGNSVVRGDESQI